jgi:very-short-patch-repair endonuclease
MRSAVSTLLKKRARRLRRDQTDAENKLWMRLRARQLCDAKFRRQHPIGPYIADFCCVKSRLIVELDGSQHVVQAERDQRRSAFLERSGYRVVRFWDNEVLQNTAAVVERIAEALIDPHPGPLPNRARVKTKNLRWKKTTTLNSL